MGRWRAGVDDGWIMGRSPFVCTLMIACAFYERRAVIHPSTSASRGDLLEWSCLPGTRPNWRRGARRNTTDDVRGQERGRRPLQVLMENHDAREGPALVCATLRRQVSPVEPAQVAYDGAALRQQRLLRVSTACRDGSGASSTQHMIHGGGWSGGGVSESSGGAVGTEGTAATAHGARCGWLGPARWRISACWRSGQIQYALGRLSTDAPLQPCRC